MKRANGRVTIIGAGIAGLTARAELSAAGFTVETVEKGRGPGGRTSRRCADGFEFDHGAQYFTARDAAFVEMVERWVSDGSVKPWSARIGALKDGLWQPSDSSTVRYVGVPGMNQPAKNLTEAGAGPIRLGCHVAVVRRNRDGAWRTVDDAGRTVSTADAVILTVPAAQALELLNDSDGAQEREPAAASPAATGDANHRSLLEARSVLAAAEIDPCWAVMAVYDPALDHGWDAAFVNEGPVAWAARNSSKPGRPGADAWVLHARGEWSLRFLESEPDWVVDELLGAFFTVAGVPSRTPVWARAHRWRYARPRNRAADGFLWNGETRLGLCGDWCAGGRVEGAYLSGRLLAHTIARSW